MLHSILQQARLFLRILLASIGGIILTGALTLSTLVWCALAASLFYTLSPQQAERAFWVTQGVALKTFYGVDCHIPFVPPCEDWPTLEELAHLIDENEPAVRELEELHGWLVVVEDKSQCPGKASLNVEYGGISDLRAIAKILNQIGEDADIAIPCRFVNV